METKTILKYMLQTHPDNVLGIVIFGSRATGDSTERSDVDLLVLTKEGKNRGYLDTIDNTPLNVICITSKTFGHLLQGEALPIDPSLIYISDWILSGKVIYDPSGTIKNIANALRDWRQSQQFMEIVGGELFKAKEQYYKSKEFLQRGDENAAKFCAIYSLIKHAIVYSIINFGTFRGPKYCLDSIRTINEESYQSLIEAFHFRVIDITKVYGGIENLRNEIDAKDR